MRESLFGQHDESSAGFLSITSRVSQIFMGGAEGTFSPRPLFSLHKRRSISRLS